MMKDIHIIISISNKNISSSRIALINPFNL